MAQSRHRIRIVHNATGGSKTAGAEWDEANGRSTACNCIDVDVPASRHECRLMPKVAPGEAQALPPVEVSAPPSSAKRDRAQQAARAARRPRVAARNPRVVYVYPTTPAGSVPVPASTSTRCPASVNFVDAARIAAHRLAEHHRRAAAAGAGHQHQRGHRQSVSAERGISRLRRVARRRNAPGPCGLPERGAHQRSVRRHRQLGPDSDRRDQDRSPS